MISAARKKTSVVAALFPSTRSTRMSLFDGDAGADRQQLGARAARVRSKRAARLDLIEADVEAERQVILDEPAGAASVVDDRQEFGGRGARRFRRRVEGPTPSAPASAPGASPRA